MVYDYINLPKHTVFSCILYMKVLLPLYANYVCEKI